MLIEGKAIQLHPLVCVAYNADFDGDQMAVHVPLTIEAQLESRALMMATNNILHPANGEPIICPTQDIVLGLYYMTRERVNAKGEGKYFGGVDEVRLAYDMQAVELHAKIKVRLPKSSDTEETMLVDTTVGRALLHEILPAGLPFELLNQCLTNKAIAKLVDTCYRTLGTKATVVFADQLMYTGFKYSTLSGISIGINDLVIPKEKESIIEQAEIQIKDNAQQYASGLVTGSERYNKAIDIWSRANEDISKAMMSAISTEEVKSSAGKKVKQASFNSVYMMADSGARGSAAQIRQLAGMRGLMARPDGSIIETPIVANFREGLNVSQYFISTHGARKGLADTALKTANSGYLTRRLVDVAQDVVVIEDDCGTTDGMIMQPIIEGGDIVVPLEQRVLGRVVAEDVLHPKDGKVLIKAGTLLEEDLVKDLDDMGVDQIKVRSPISCQTRRGICAKCYGRDLGRGHLVNSGEAVGVIAAQSIGEPGTQLTMRTFHIGGAASQSALQSNVQVKTAGQVKLNNVKTVTNSKGNAVTVSRSGELVVIDQHGRERERYKLPYGAEIPVSDGAKVKPGEVTATWDPHTHPVVTEVAGIIKFTDLVEGVSMQRKTDELTGLTSIVITDPKQQRASGKELRPTIHLVDESGKEVCFANTNVPVSYFLPVGAVVSVEDGAPVGVGDVLARIPQEGSKNKDITGGLPRVADLFEARKPKDTAVLAEASGIVSFGKETKGKRRLLITPEGGGDPCEIMIPKWRYINVFEGENIQKGEVICDGPMSPHDILRLKGVFALTEYLVNEIQDVYRLQGVRIDDKHIEVIVRQMLRRVEVTSIGDSKLIQGEQADYVNVLEENDHLQQAGQMTAKYDRVLLGITKASLLTESFISAAAFQETTRVLTEAAVNGRVDTLFGLKENVTVGRLIPAGTGMLQHQLAKQAAEREQADSMKEVTAEEVESALSAALSSEEGMPPADSADKPQAGDPA